MIELKSTPVGVRIDYPGEGSFCFVIKAPKQFKEGYAQLNISLTGGTPSISKKYLPKGDCLEISLTDMEIKKLLCARNHYYKVVFVYGKNETEILSGTIKIK